MMTEQDRKRHRLLVQVRMTALYDHQRMFMREKIKRREGLNIPQSIVAIEAADCDEHVKDLAKLGLAALALDVFGVEP